MKLLRKKRVISARFYAKHTERQLFSAAYNLVVIRERISLGAAMRCAPEETDALRAVASPSSLAQAAVAIVSSPILSGSESAGIPGSEFLNIHC